jgi:signal transduction histidine kinase
LNVELPRDARVCVEPHDLRLILQNLVSNAVKFGDAQAPVITIDAERRGEQWCVSVRDNGAGIAPEHEERIFGAFERAPSGAQRVGYGLGLAICQRLVARHGGRIGVEALPESGTRFWFTLPAADAGARSEPEPQIGERA